jgi:mannose-6-phosphate isomerase-like protein (cupin superfamily)
MRVPFKIGDMTNAENGRVLRAFGQEARILISSEQTGNAFCLMRFVVSSGGNTPPHLRQNEHETFIIEAGEIEIDRGGGAGVEKTAAGLKRNWRNSIQVWNPIPLIG